MPLILILHYTKNQPQKKKRTFKIALKRRQSLLPIKKFDLHQSKNEAELKKKKRKKLKLRKNVMPVDKIMIERNL